MCPLTALICLTPTPYDARSPHLLSGLRECIMLMQVDISERAKVEATLAKLTESQVWR